jgi:hypothetical protein
MKMASLVCLLQCCEYSRPRQRAEIQAKAKILDCQRRWPLPLGLS